MNTSRSIQFWLRWLVLACTVPAIVVAGLLIAGSHTRTRFATEREALSTSRALMQAVDASLHTAQTALNLLASSPYLEIGAMPAFYARAQEVLEFLPGNGIVLIDSTGQQVMSTIIPYGRPLPRTGVVELVRVIFDTGKPAVSDFYIGATSKQPQVAVGVPVYRNEEVIYALTMGYLPSSLAQILERQNVPETWLVAILDRNGVIVSRNKEAAGFIGKKINAEFRNQIAAAQSGIFEATSLDGVPITGAFTRSPNSGLTVAFGIPKTLFNAEMQRALAINTATAIAVLLVGVLLANLISARISRSIRAMVGPALALGTQQRVAVPATEIREVDELGHALRRAAALLDEGERERHHAHRRREQIEARLRSSERLAMVGQMARSMAHDFGNLLTPILSSLQSVQQQPNHPRSAERIALALSATQRATKLVRSLVVFATQQPLAVEVVDANRVIQDLEGILAQTLQTPDKLTLQLASNTWQVKADIGQLERAILNLVTNARDATKESGTVSIATANVTMNGEQDGLSGDYVAISVSDTGTGMPPEVLARAFEPLFTTKSAGAGTGLGLQSIQTFTKKCGGGAVIESEVGKGTTVTLFLKRADEMAHRSR